MDRKRFARLVTALSLSLSAVLVITGATPAGALAEPSPSITATPEATSNSVEPSPSESSDPAPDASAEPDSSPPPRLEAEANRSRPTPSERLGPDLIIHDQSEGAAAQIPEDERTELVGPDWDSSNDIAWVISGDSDGLHVLTADASQGYEWNRIATLSARGFETDQWIGNACLTSDARTLAVVFAPRGFTNDEAQFNHGGFGALVDVKTGETHELGAGFTLAYFNPGCGVGSRVAFTQFDEARTRIVNVDANSPEAHSALEVASQITSAVPASSGLIAAASGAVVHIDDAGTTTPISPATGTPYDLAITETGRLAYVTHDGETATAFLTSTTRNDEPVAFATGELDEVGVTLSGDDTLHLLGDADVLVKDLPGVVIHSATRATGDVSSAGLLAIDATFVDAASSAETGADSTRQGTLVIETTATASGATVEFRISSEVGDALTAGTSSAPGPTEEPLNRAESRASTQSSTSPISSGSPCAIPRNNPTIQALQPNLAEVEWAVDQAVRGNLAAQTTFPRPTLTGTSTSGGMHVPPQIVLGILAQESNFWQASRFTVPGVTGNPLMGDYFGIRSASEDEPWWTIDYAEADCGYGIAQVTTGMRSGEMPYAQQLMIATDYRANISRGLQILIEKWNQTRSAGLIINDGHPKYMENWFYALWAYNTGFYPEGSVPQPWGVGWLNNPINPIYAPNRGSFLDESPSDAAHPQDWPYPEKVLGFAAHSAYFLNSVSQGQLGDTFSYATAFTPAWWTSSDGEEGDYYRELVKPPIDLFCDSSNNCDPEMSIYIPSQGYNVPCYNRAYSGGPFDLRCWYHEPASWKTNCSIACGYEYMTYSLSAPKPASSNSYPPNCSRTGLPSTALIVDNVPNGTPSQRCGVVSTTGSFQFDFAPGPNGDYPSKIDLHQLGAGFNGHFNFTRVRLPSISTSESEHLAVSGTWNLGQSLAGKWTRVLVHMPSHGAWTQQASYEINTGSSTVTRSVNQRNYADQWVPLGTFLMSGTPTVTLKNTSAEYNSIQQANALHGVDDIAWDAVAFVPLDQKPADFIVALGDSFSSGEGTSATNGVDFARGSDHHGADPHFRNACHRSAYAWPYKVDPPSIAGTSNIGQLLAANDTRLDFHMLACAGAETENLLPSVDDVEHDQVQQFGEQTQLDRGFLDANTTLVTLTIGGNDIGFGPVLQECIKSHGKFASPPTECKIDPAPEEENFSGTIEQMVDSRLAALPGKVTTVLQEIGERAPNARIVLMGYPSIFEDGTLCVLMSEANRPWLTGVSQRLNKALTKAAFDAGTFVIYENPQYRFRGHNLCAEDNALRRLVLQTTPGDSEVWVQPPDAPGFGISAQSIHPNPFGSELYAQAANNALSTERLPLSGTLVGGAPTTYYATLRWMEGPTAISVSSFSGCAQELRIGLRSGAPGTQTSNSLSWTSPHDMQNFIHAPDSLATSDLPGNTYAMNARLTTACAGGGTQSWAGDLYR